MEGRCGAQTLTGAACKAKSQGRCWQHKGPQCSVCLTCMSGQSSTRKLECGHQFHMKCLNRWKLSCRGPDPTCPMCRAPFDVPTFRCRLIIERVGTGDPSRTVTQFETTNATNILEGFGLDMRTLMPNHTGRFFTDIHFDINADEILSEVLTELGLPIPIVPSTDGPEANTVG